MKAPSDLYSKAQWEWVAQRREEGYTYPQLAEFLGVSIGCVTNHIGSKPGKKLPPLKERAREFNALREE